eukprot:2126306-Ditylum_brightwellii.AAC.1
MQQSAKHPITRKETSFPTARLGYTICHNNHNHNHHNHRHYPNFTPACERSEKGKGGKER